jgi:hypothetical protein
VPFSTVKVLVKNRHTYINTNICSENYRKQELEETRETSMKGIYIMAISGQLFLNPWLFIMSGQNISQQLGVIKVDKF